MTQLHRALVANIKFFRSQLKLSQAELAERCQISVGYVGEIEVGHKFPSPDVLERLATALQVSPFQLLMDLEESHEFAEFKTKRNFYKEIATKVGEEVVRYLHEKESEG